ncbi:LysR family transcriptional regulator [Paenibacillus pinisoli]|uniref:LysR family transcriptional regulator n=1 Tax=Paenibacillus pinisoli TaxID=1276110 RepID=A0A3A6PBQ8_9BACL|nr:LysR family transcriptional regulator [Paenibacillus pinisoli]RJX38702.1 LysR family transcriptional regulator [Paenibacillus pinisoli]
MRIEQLQYIVEIASTGSFSIAAEKLHVSQPNISQSVAALEQEVGVQLFHRTRGGTVPTEAGEAVIAKARHILAKLHELKATANEHTEVLRGKLVIGAISGICTSFLPRTLSAFAIRHPYVELEILEEHSGGIEEKLLENRLDLGLMGITGEYANKHLRAERFLSCEIMACVGVQTPLAARKSISFADILHYPLVGVSGHMKELLLSYGTPKQLFHSKGTEAAKYVTAEGVAISFSMDISLRNDPHVAMGKIVPIPIEEKPSVHLYWAHDRKGMSAASEAFLSEFLMQVEKYKRMARFE